MPLHRNTSLLPARTGFANVESMPLPTPAAHAAVRNHPPQPIRNKWQEEEYMDTHLMIGVAVIFGLIVIAASRDVLRRLRPQPRLVPVKVRTMKPARRDDASSL